MIEPLRPLGIRPCAETIRSHWNRSLQAAADNSPSPSYFPFPHRRFPSKQAHFYGVITPFERPGNP